MVLIIVPQSYVRAQELKNNEMQTHAIAMHGQPKYDAAATQLDYTSTNATKGGVLKQSVIGSFDTLNNNNIKGKPAAGLNYLYDRLAARVWDEPFSLYGLIAEKIIVPDDRSSITFHINKTARFHDNKPITTKDVEFSFETLKKYGRPNTRNVYGLVKNVIITSPSEITFDFGEDYDRETALIIAMMPILPKHYWSDKDFDSTIVEPPLGSGPYKIKSVEIGRNITYERVKDYWAQEHFVNKGQHNFDELSFDYYRDKNVAIQAFKSHEFDIFREFDAAAWQTNFAAEADASYKAQDFPHSRPERVRAFIFNTQRPLFEDKNVRHALSLAFDFEWMNKFLFHEQTKRINSTFPNTSLASPKNVALFQNNESARKKLKRAGQLLLDAGWAVQDGKRVHKDTGEEFKFSLVINQPHFEKVALHWSQQLKKLGIELELRSIDTAQFTGLLNTYDYDMILHGWTNSLSPGTEQQIYWGCDAARTEGSRNYARICNEQIDALTKQVSRSKTRDDLVETIHNLDHALMNEYLMIPLYYIGKDYIAYWPELQHPGTTPIYGAVIESWWSKSPSDNQ
jgi:ABC-type oligopeptide transport system substrate-binding subunit